jgi:hypothetical protein
MRTLTLLALGALAVRAQEHPPRPAERQVTVKDGETVRVLVRVSSREEHHSAVVRFPEPIAHVVSSWDPSQISVQEEDSRLVLKLQAKAEGYLDVVLVGGTLVRLFVSGVTAPAASDSAIQVRLGGQAHPERESPAPKGAASGALELIRAMRLGEVPPDATVRTGRGEVLFRALPIEVKALYVYETGRYRGWVLGVENLSSREAYPLDITRFGGDALVALGARELVIGPGRSTRLYVIDGK